MARATTIPAVYMMSFMIPADEVGMVSEKLHANRIGPITLEKVMPTPLPGKPQQERLAHQPADASAKRRTAAQTITEFVNSSTQPVPLKYLVEAVQALGFGASAASVAITGLIAEKKIVRLSKGLYGQAHKQKGV